MNWTVNFILSLVILLIAVFAVIYCERKKIKRGKLLSSFNMLMCGVALSAFVLFMPYYFYASSTNLRGLQAVFVSFYSVLRTFALDGDYSFFMEEIAAGGKLFNTAYLTLSLVIMVAAPFFTFGVVLSFFKDVKAYFRMVVRKNKPTYIFSELNEKALALAEDIRKNHADAAIIFTGVSDSKEETEEELKDDAADINAICFKKDILSVKFNLNKWQKETTFFIIGEKESENLSQSLKLINMYNDRDNTNLYLFSTTKGSELVLTSAVKGKIKVRRINEVQSLISRNLFDEGHVLFDSAMPKEDGKKHISALIVGMGQYGTTMLKALTWYCQMDGYKINITAVDKSKNAKSCFEAQCPDLMAEENRGVYIEGEAEYDIDIRPEIDVNSMEFSKIIAEIDNITYVFTALGTDEDNIKTAVNIRTLCERRGFKPIIQAVVHNSEEKAALEGIHNYVGEEYNISFIGDVKSSYTEKVIVDSDLEEAALNCHLKWSPDKEDEFWKYEYNYRSSIASAIHIKARIHCKIPGADKPEDQLTPDEQKIIGSIEHRRWNAYMRADGYVYSGSDEKSSRNDLGKMHHNLVPTSRLGEGDINKDIRVGTV